MGRKENGTKSQDLFSPRPVLGTRETCVISAQRCEASRSTGCQMRRLGRREVHFLIRNLVACKEQGQNSNSAPARTLSGSEPRELSYTFARVSCHCLLY